MDGLTAIRELRRREKAGEMPHHYVRSQTLRCVNLRETYSLGCHHSRSAPSRGMLATPKNPNASKLALTT